MAEALVRMLLVAVGGGAGALLRYGINLGSLALGQAAFPWGTLLANTLGCGAAGVLMALVIDRPVLSPEQRLLLFTGLLGGLTTFSTFSYETLALVREGHHLKAGLNVGANLVLSLVSVWIGWMLARTIISPVS